MKRLIAVLVLATLAGSVLFYVYSWWTDHYISNENEDSGKTIVIENQDDSQEGPDVSIHTMTADKDENTEANAIDSAVEHDALASGDEHAEADESDESAEADEHTKADEQAEEACAACFDILPIDDPLKEKMQGKSFKGITIKSYESLRLVKVRYIGFDDVSHEGELVVHEAIAEKVVSIFKTLYEARFPIERMVLIDDYNADDDLSMQANNTSAFNDRLVSGTNHPSNHAYGLAIDINPLVNPYVTKNGVSPVEGEPYTDRTLDAKGMIKAGDVCYNAFIENGFSWGGEWQNSKDYQHFDVKIEGINQ